ncbi:hypothetical protein NET02_08995 [Thermomicrobiaceae bacterium CFH 74404]|uniref:Fibronectin type-III domain-containing protein n=1 Tax=Thermalbibacter longus TaxID=2951981 RepID=A0AA42BA05_9BACT|nr:hypothetical protein [Thermalbibacter longus]MCM8749281.1 hypothetical protein [Thermalbibacter longus]
MRAVLLALAIALLLAPASELLPERTHAQPGWQWFMVDTHVHSSVSADGYTDVGIHAAAAKALGYNALFLTDHNGGSSFHINNLTANHMVFEDSYTRWEKGTFGSLSSSRNELATSPVNTGSRSLRLSARSSGYGEAFVWTKRGPNFRSGDIILKVSIYPTRIDTGSGIYVSVSIGGDPTVVKDPYGYTTQDGIVSPGKSTVLVWQLGSARAPSSDPNQRVLVYSLGTPTLNAWNHYTINVTQALNDIPAADRPLDYNGLTFLKMAAAGNGGTTEAYFDTYSIDASNPVAPADEFVYRTPRVDDFDTSTFEVFASYEMGQQKHSNRFNFAITDPTQYVSYLYGSDGIAETQQTGYPAQLNHPGTTITVQEAIDTKGGGADFLEVREPEWVAAWDTILEQGVQIIGTWSSDTHTGESAGKAATYIYAPALDFNELIHSYFEGRVYNARNDFGGRVVFNLDAASQEPYPARYPVYVSDAQTTANVHLAVTGDLRTSYTIRWIRNGEVFASENPPGSSYDATKAVPLDGPFTYVRAEILSSSGSLRAMTQPIFFIDVSGLPTDKRLHIDRTTTADDIWYNKLYTKGITATSWSGDIQALSFTLNNPAEALVRLRMQTDAAPDRVKVDGTLVAAAGSLPDFEAATGSSWYYDSGAKLLHLKVRHAGTTADVLVAFSAQTDTEPPTPPANLTASAINSNRVDLRWDPSTDNVGVAGYDIYRDGALLASIGTETSYSDTTVVAETTYSYEVKARDAAGNVSGPSNSVTVTTPAAALFSDGFETGDLSQWTSSTGLIVQQQEVFSGSYAARGTSTGSATYATKQLGSTYSDLYYRLRFKRISQGSNTVYLLRFRTGTGGSLLGLYVSSTGKLGFRNDVAGQSTTSSLTVTTGEWHEVQVHLVINGSSSLVEVWYDGTKVDALSKTQSLGTNPIGRIQLGENSTGRTYDFAFDEVAVDTAFIGGGGGGGGGDTTPPETTITSAPPATTDQTSATFEFTASEPNSTFQCKLDTGTSEACTSPRTYTGLTAGSHTFTVVATDPAGNIDPSPATHTWEITAPSDTQAPTVPANLSATATSSTRIDLRWDPSTDNIGVAGYTVYRDGVQLATVDGSTTTYADTTVTAGTSYTYTVDAFDAAGNHSAQSTPATATTPAAGLLFSDDFESGTLAKWSTVSGLTITSEAPHGGTYAARGNSTGSATFAIATLSQTASELYYRIWFNVASQGSNTVYLLKFRTSTNSSLGGVYLSSTGKLSYRSDVAARSVTTTTSVTRGTWHQLQVRLVTGSSGLIEIWYDGTKVVSAAENFGTNPIGRIQLGENSTGRTYDVIFDDVAAGTSFIP